MTIWAMNCKK